jgi:hypothetical protein
MQKSICGFQEKEMDNKKKNDRTHTQTKNIYTVREREKKMDVATCQIPSCNGFWGVHRVMVE